MQYGELLAEGLEGGEVEGEGEGGGGAVGAGLEGTAVGVDGGGASRVVAGGVGAYTVDTTHIALVLNGTGEEEGAPGLHTGCGP